MKWFEHLKTISYHKYLVMKGCFAVGLYWQGICHDLSKYSPTEFFVGAKYFQGDRSPNNAEREEIGYSTSWLHHKGRNKHHYEYWTDYSLERPDRAVSPVKMPEKYVIEMLMDRIAASKVYRKDAYTDSDPLYYYENSLERVGELIHPDTQAELGSMLRMLAEKGEAETFRYIRENRIKSLREEAHQNNPLWKLWTSVKEYTPDRDQMIALAGAICILLSIFLIWSKKDKRG